MTPPIGAQVLPAGIRINSHMGGTPATCGASKAVR